MASNAEPVLAQWAPSDETEVTKAADELASARFIALSTWKWLDVCAATGGKPVLPLLLLPPAPAECGRRWGTRRPASLAASSEERAPVRRRRQLRAQCIRPRSSTRWATSQRIRCTTGRPTITRYPKRCRSTSRTSLRPGNPNGGNLPHWPAVKAGQPAAYMHIDVETRAETEAHRGRYTVLDGLSATPAR